jgi:hypothetical protein
MVAFCHRVKGRVLERKDLLCGPLRLKTRDPNHIKVYRGVADYLKGTVPCP